MFSRLFKTPKSSLQLFRKNQAAMLPNDAESPQVPSETFFSLPIIRKVWLTRLYVGSSLALRLTSSSDRTPAHRSRTTLRFVYVGLRPRSGFARPVLLIVCRFLYDLAPFS